MSPRGRAFRWGFAAGIALFAAANLVSFVVRSGNVAVLFGCADCIRAWGFPLEVAHHGGFFGTSYEQPGALAIDVLTALAGSLALGWVMARRVPR